MSESREVRVVGASGVQVAELSFGALAGKCHVELRLPDGRVSGADKPDYFEALLSIRAELQREGLSICCQGARRDVWPSGMARDMGAGLKAYILSLTEEPTREDLVDIFAPADCGLVGTVEEQERQHDEWVRAQRSRRP